MIAFAVIRDKETDKNVAVVAHDPDLGRIVYKVRDPGDAIERALSLNYDRSLIVLEPVSVNGATIMKRRRSVPKDMDYLHHLLDKAVKLPYEVRTLRTVETSEGLDSYVDKLADQLTAKQVKQSGMYPRLRLLDTVGRFKVYEVDGDWVRTNKDVQFVNVGQSLHHPFIPDDEWWIDKERLHQAEELPFLELELSVQRMLMEKGMPFETAKSIAYGVEQKARSKGKEFDPRHVYMDDLGVIGDNHWWVVNGPMVRDFHPRFKEGGHWRVYPFIPKGEGWIDSEITLEERPKILKHEVDEENLMSKGWPYVAAHTQVSEGESEERHMPLTDLKLTPIPFTRQTQAYTCGAAALQSVLLFYGRQVKEEELVQELGTTEKGTAPEAIRRVASKYHLDATVVDKLDVATLRKLVDWEIPVIVAYQAWAEGEENWSEDWSDGHYSTVMAVDDKNVYLDDPSQYGVVGVVALREFLTRWHDVDPHGKKRIRLGIVVTERSV